MKGDGSSCKWNRGGIGGGEYSGGMEGGKYSRGMELISFNSRTSHNIRITIYLINAVYSAQVGRCVSV